MLNGYTIQQLIQKNDFYPRKRLGQNFLIDKNILRKIIEAVDIKPDDLILEIGAGFGILTTQLAERAKKVVAIELDKKLCQILKETLSCYDNVQIIQQDILKFNFFKYRQDKLKIIGNLPYYITTPLIIYLLQQENLSSVLITVQKEVAMRLVAKPGKKDYGAISCFVQYYTHPSILFYIKKTSFWPRPQVDSAFISLQPLMKPIVKVLDEKMFFKIIRVVFQKRRKTVLNGLTDIISKSRLLETFERIGIDPQRRGETFFLKEFADIANSLS